MALQAATAAVSKFFFLRKKRHFFFLDSATVLSARVFSPLGRFELDSTAIMSLQSVAGGAEDVVEDNDDCRCSEDSPAGVNQRDTTRTVPHYRVKLPSYPHGDGKDKKRFYLWITRLKLAVKACAEGQQLDIATCLSRDTLAC